MFALLAIGGCGYSTNTGPNFLAPVRDPVVAASKISQFNTPILTYHGYVLYVFQPDDRGRPRCRGPCAQIWPPLTIDRKQKPKAQNGVQPSLLGSEPYSGETSVVTYDGWPLYRYRKEAQDAADGQAYNLNGGYWYVMATDGTPIVPPGDPPAP